MNRTIWQEIECEEALTPALRDAIIRACGERGRKALRALEECRVKRYLDFYVVVGRGGEYVVEEDFCTCNDFLFRGGECWHILAVRLARRFGLYEPYELWYQDCLNAGK
ncbi:MAG: SWIM zinc finger family protein [Methanomicrobiaceae archaeon]|uniref:SWIM-type domain-containing protein n=1 Tax=hydrocarbon metagenome TaxID=938273 RepID=A0A0W8FFB8_9ZZZZ|nr:SWIM zinc finger family protein [Methanomicrobiaceae archaeon]MDD5419870.1 SWIM zinc finger family protein [Methanomicrobiaceae archaeon]